MQEFSVNTIADYKVSSFSEVKTYNMYLDDVGIELLVDVFDSGEYGEYRYRVGARLASESLKRQLGDALPDDLCYGNGGPTPETALALSHWDGLNKVIRLLN